MAWQLVDQGQGGGDARLVETDGDRVVVEATRPFPIGATLVALDPATSVQYRVKVRGGRRTAPGWFRVEGRFVSMTKEERAALLAQAAAVAPAAAVAQAAPVADGEPKPQG
jgi:hypothetical protein